MLIDVVPGLSVMHALNIIHRDMKSATILFTCLFHAFSGLQFVTRDDWNDNDDGRDTVCLSLCFPFLR
jgi:serine/threonine protein kinase